MTGRVDLHAGWGLSAILMVARVLDWPKFTKQVRHAPVWDYKFGHQHNAPDIVVIEVGGGFMRSLSIEQAEAMAEDLRHTAAQCRKVAGL